MISSLRCKPSAAPSSVLENYPSKRGNLIRMFWRDDKTRQNGSPTRAGERVCRRQPASNIVSGNNAGLEWLSSVALPASFLAEACRRRAWETAFYACTNARRFSTVKTRWRGKEGERGHHENSAYVYVERKEKKKKKKEHALR